MVLAVQSDTLTWESPLFCDGEPVLWNLKRPLRAALAATARLLGGLLPLHLRYDAVLRRAETDWLWAVGSSPLAPTSAGLAFGAHHAEVLHRHYVVAALHSSAAALDEARALLASVRPSRDAYELLTQGPSSAHRHAARHAARTAVGAAAEARATASGGLEGADDAEGAPPVLRLQTAHAKLRQLHQRVLAHTAKRELDAACGLLHSLHTASERLLALARQTASALRLPDCVALGAHAHVYDVPGSTGWWSTAALAFVVLAPLLAVLKALFPSLADLAPGKRKRPKVNID